MLIRMYDRHSCIVHGTVESSYLLSWSMLAVVRCDTVTHGGRLGLRDPPRMEKSLQV